MKPLLFPARILNSKRWKRRNAGAVARKKQRCATLCSSEHSIWLRRSQSFNEGRGAFWEKILHEALTSNLVGRPGKESLPGWKDRLVAVGFFQVSPLEDRIGYK